MPGEAAGERAAGESVQRAVVGSKKFTESVILGELARAVALAEAPQAEIEHRDQLGGTRVLWNALRGGDIDLYPEYTGTIAQEILGGDVAGDLPSLRAALAARGVAMGEPLGFSNTYTLGMLAPEAERLSIATISDLRLHPELRLGFTNEFMDRADGWPGLRVRYGLSQSARGLDHDLAYRGLLAGTLQVIDLYSTDAEIREHGLRTLEDDLGYFPDYRAVFLWRVDLERRSPSVVEAVRRLEGAIDGETMIAMNARAKIDRVAEAQVAADVAAERFGARVEVRTETRAERLGRATLEHLTLVVVSLGAAILVAVPLGVLAARRPRLGQVLLGIAGIFQTIPSLALLVFMIPLFGIGGPPAMVALFLYSLLPILRNTTTGLTSIPAELIDSARALGLDARQRLRHVELPLASRSILAGVKVSAVINIGTATLGALIGAGGYGQAILTGIRLDDLALILEGAIPAALLALVAQGGFELVDRWLVPRGLRLEE
ncbi:MAG: glycine betaine ABC transporter substrate-binding protein [Acidobacteriota bacterium]